jgi:hypothetical protein
MNQAKPDETPPPPAGASDTDYDKLDGSLTAAIEDAIGVEDVGLPVFLNLDPGRKDEHAALLQRLGRPSEEDTTGPLTATLSPRQVRALSLDPAVMKIKLAGSRRPLTGG